MISRKTKKGIGKKTGEIRTGDTGGVTTKEIGKGAGLGVTKNTDFY